MIKTSPFSRLALFLALTLPLCSMAQSDSDLPEDGDLLEFDGSFDPGDFDFTDGDQTFDDGEDQDFVDPGDLIYEDGIFYALAAPSTSIIAFDFVAVDSLVNSGLPTTSAVRQVNFSAARSALRDVNDRLFRHRAGLGASLAKSSAKQPGVSLSKDGKATLPAESAPASLQRWEIFATGTFGEHDVNRIDSQAGFEGDSWAGTVGVEYHFTTNLTVGAAFTYGFSDFNLTDNLGSMHLESPTGSVYISYANTAFYADLLYSYGSSDMCIDRNAVLGSHGYRGDTHSSQHYGEFNTGYNFALANGHLLTGPFAGLNYLNGQTDGYREKTSGPAALSYDEQNYDSLISQLGWQLSSQCHAGKCTIVTQIHAAWAHEYLDNEDVVKATLVTSPFLNGPANSFSATQKTTRPGTDYLAAGAGLAFLIGENWSVNLDYEGEFFRDDSTAHFASVRAGFTF